MSRKKTFLEKLQDEKAAAELNLRISQNQYNKTQGELFRGKLVILEMVIKEFENGNIQESSLQNPSNNAGNENHISST